MAAARLRLGITAVQPSLCKATLWPRVMPQYLAGHLATVRSAETRLDATWHGRLLLGGNSYYGAGVNDTVLRSHTLAARILGFAANRKV